MASHVFRPGIAGEVVRRIPEPESLGKPRHSHTLLGQNSDLRFRSRNLLEISFGYRITQARAGVEAIAEKGASAPAIGCHQPDLVPGESPKEGGMKIAELGVNSSKSPLWRIRAFPG